MTDKQAQEELRRCREGHAGMSGPEYFWYNYCRVNGELPKPGSWSQERFEQYKKEAEAYRNGPPRARDRRGSLMALHPITYDQCFDPNITAFMDSEEEVLAYHGHDLFHAEAAEYGFKNHYVATRSWIKKYLEENLEFQKDTSKTYQEEYIEKWIDTYTTPVITL